MYLCDDPPPTISNGKSRGNSSVVTYTCEEGYHLVGDNTLYCNNKNLWDRKVPECSFTGKQLKCTLPK